jgi:hypothetical protein
VCEAVETHLHRKRLQDLYAYGEAQARKLGIEESGVDGIVEQERRYTTPRYTTVRSKTRKSPQLQ